MTHIKIQDVRKLFEGNRAIDHVSIDIAEGEFFTLLGPSGCGKTTLLRTLAGFYSQDEGDLHFGEQHINYVPAHKRNIGMVFQNYAIFPHLTVFENVAYGLKARKVSKADIKTRVTEALEMVELAHLAERQPSQLSGGQQQRVALARAIVIHPGVLLMDEPLSNLDAKLRVKMREDIRDLQKRLNITTIYVTHDQEEALAVSDRIAVMKDGKVQQIGKPHEIYLSPANKFVANFIGSTNFISGQIQSVDANDFGNVMVEGKSLPVQLRQSVKGKVLYSVRPEQIKIVEEARDDRPVWAGEVLDATFLGQSVVYKIKLESGLVITVIEHSIRYSDLRSAGEQVLIDLNPDEAVIFSEDGEVVINVHKNLSF